MDMLGEFIGCWIRGNVMDFFRSERALGRIGDELTRLGSEWSRERPRPRKSDGEGKTSS